MKRRPTQTVAQIEAEPPVEPNIERFFERDAADLADNEMRVSPTLIRGLCRVSKSLIRTIYSTKEDAERLVAAAQEPTVIMPDHDDFMDILAMGRFCAGAGDIYPRYLGKASLPRILGRAGLIPIDRSAEASPRWGRALSKMAEHTLIVEHRPLVVFGEGTVFPDEEEVQDIQAGAIHIARSNKCGILPVGIDNTEHMLSTTPLAGIPALMLRRRDVFMAVGKVISTDREVLEQEGLNIPGGNKAFKGFMSELVRDRIQEQRLRARDMRIRMHKG